MLPANIVFSTDPAAIVAVNVPLAKFVRVTAPLKSPPNVMVGSADKAKSKFWFVASHVTSIPVSTLLAIKSCAL